MPDIETAEGSFTYFTQGLIEWLDDRPDVDVLQISTDRKLQAVAINVRIAGVGDTVIEVTKNHPTPGTVVKKAATDAGFEYREEDRPYPPRPY